MGPHHTAAQSNYPIVLNRWLQRTEVGLYLIYPRTNVDNERPYAASQPKTRRCHVPWLRNNRYEEPQILPRYSVYCLNSKRQHFTWIPHTSLCPTQQLNPEIDESVFGGNILIHAKYHRAGSIDPSCLRRHPHHLAEITETTTPIG